MEPGIDRGFVIRADASTEIGSGHVMRCIALAQQLRRRGLSVLFCCCDVPGHLGRFLLCQGFEVAMLPPAGSRSTSVNQVLDAHATVDAWRGRSMRPAWVIVDHYLLDAAWHREIRAAGPQLAVVDDLADRPLVCDALINQNPTPELHKRYEDCLSTAEVRLMLGPSYTLLREEFVAIGAEIVLRDLTRPPQALVVFLGGADVDNLTMHVVEQLVGFKFSGSVHVLLGQMNSNRQLVQAACTAHGFDCRLAGQPLGSILIDTRLAVVACGMFAVELQAMGIPCVLVPLSPIQHRVATHFTETGNALLLSQEQLCNDATLSHLMKRILEKSVTRRPLPLLDGARLVIESLLGISHEQTKDYLPSSHR